MLKEELIEWLLTGEPWVVYRTLTDLLDRDEEDTVVVTAKTVIPQHPFIQNIFGGLNKVGYWGTLKDIHTWWPKKNTTFLDTADAGRFWFHHRGQKNCSSL